MLTFLPVGVLAAQTGIPASSSKGNETAAEDIRDCRSQIDTTARHRLRFLKRTLMRRKILCVLVVAVVGIGGYALTRKTQLGSCVAYALGGFREPSVDRSKRFLGKVADEDTARCRGGKKSVQWRS